MIDSRKVIKKGSFERQRHCFCLFFPPPFRPLPGWLRSRCPTRECPLLAASGARGSVIKEMICCRIHIFRWSQHCNGCGLDSNWEFLLIREKNTCFYRRDDEQSKCSFKVRIQLLKRTIPANANVQLHCWIKSRLSDRFIWSGSFFLTIYPIQSSSCSMCTENLLVAKPIHLILINK